MKKTLAVQNLTAMTSCFRAEVTNYKPLRVKSSLLENLMSKSDRVQYGTYNILSKCGSKVMYTNVTRSMG